VTGVAPGRLISWGITAVLLGWVVVYNVMRVGGSTPADAALPSFIVGGIIGIVVLAVAMFVRARLIRAGRLHPMNVDADVPDPAAVTPDQRRVLSAAWPVVAAAAVAELATGLWMFMDWRGTPSFARATAELVMAGWFVFAGLWMGWEARHIRDMDAGGIDSVALGALLTTVLAGVGISRQFVTGMQIITVIVAGLASVVAYWLVWYLVRRRGVPGMAIAAGLISLAALLIPLFTR
jgi:hypothetical protein